MLEQIEHYLDLAGEYWFVIIPVYLVGYVSGFIAWACVICGTKHDIESPRGSLASLLGVLWPVTLPIFFAGLILWRTWKKLWAIRTKWKRKWIQEGVCYKAFGATHRVEKVAGSHVWNSIWTGETWSYDKSDEEYPDLISVVLRNGVPCPPPSEVEMPDSPKAQKIPTGEGGPVTMFASVENHDDLAADVEKVTQDLHDLEQFAEQIAEDVRNLEDLRDELHGKHSWTETTIPTPVRREDIDVKEPADNVDPEMGYPMSDTRPYLYELANGLYIYIIFNEVWKWHPKMMSDWEMEFQGPGVGFKHVKNLRDWDRIRRAPLAEAQQLQEHIDALRLKNQVEDAPSPVVPMAILGWYGPASGEVCVALRTNWAKETIPAAFRTPGGEWHDGCVNIKWRDEDCEPMKPTTAACFFAEYWESRWPEKS